MSAFLAGASSTLEIAIYDLSLQGSAAEMVRDALRQAVSRGVAVRLLYNQERTGRRLLPPPGFVDHDYLRSLGVPSRAIPGVPDLMHHKYAVRDALSVWTGSTNWTTDSWTREENVVLRLHDREVAAAYRRDFEEIWEERGVQASGKQQPYWAEPAAGLRVRPYFTPGRADKLVHEIAQRIATARRRLSICSPVLTSGPILASLTETLERPSLRLAGCYDATQMAEVEQQWRLQPRSAWKLDAWKWIRAAMPWGAKRSTPYQAGSVHDFMHAKCLVADDTVFTGSYNLSHSGEDNAENVLEIEHAPTADLFADYVARVAARYPMQAAQAALDSRSI